MISAIYSVLLGINSAWLFLLGIIACILVYIFVLFAHKCNRSKQGILTAAIGILATEIISGIIWKFVYFPDGEYVNLGIAGGVWLIIFPILLLIFAALITKNNSKIVKIASDT